MPSSFTGHGNYDGVALSVDGTNWFRIVSLTGTSSTNSYQLQSFNLSAIAASFGLSLSADTRIKFQSYDVNAFFVPTQGVAFDDVSVYASLRAGGFEVPAVGTGFFGAFQFGPSGTAWSYAGGAGVTGNGSGFTGGNPPAPEGTQVAFLQSINSSVSQTFTAAAGTYRVSFRAAQRAFQPGGGAQQVRVLVDGADLGTFTPAGTAYQAFATAALTLADGVHTLSLVGLTAGDNTALLDLVAVAPA
jgi:hypothetical protein